MTMTEPTIRHTKSAPAYFKAVTGPDVPAGTFDAIVAVFNNIDLGGDRLIPGCFADGLAAWQASGDPIPVIFSHQWDDLYAHVGTVDPANVKELEPGDPELPPELMELGGLLIKGAQMDLDAPGEAGAFAQTLWSKLQRRAIKEFSFAYDIPPGGARPTKDAMDLVKVGLIEVGPTLKGMNPATALLNAKAARKAVAGLSPMAALELLDDLVPVPRTSKAAPAAHAKRLPTGTRPAGAVEDTLDAIASSSRVWGMTKYGNELYAVHMEGTFLADGKALITTERWSDPYGEGPLWELSYTLDDAGALITDAKAVEVTVTLSTPDATSAKRRAKALLDRGFDRKTALWLTFLDADAVGTMYGPDEDSMDVGTGADPDDIGDLAAGLDAVLDSMTTALEAGDIGQATALLAAANSTSDELLEALGIPDADDPSVGAGEASTSGLGMTSYAGRRKRGQARGAAPAKGEEPSAATSPTGVLLEIEELSSSTPTP